METMPVHFGRDRFKKKVYTSITKIRTLSRLKSPENRLCQNLIRTVLTEGILCQSRSGQMMKKHLTTGIFNF